MATLIDKVRAQEDKLDQKQEDTHGDYEAMKAVFEKRIDLYNRSLRKKEGLTKIDWLRLENKKEWQMYTC